MTDAAVTYMPSLAGVENSAYTHQTGEGEISHDRQNGYGTFVAGEHTSAPTGWAEFETRVLESGPMKGAHYDVRCSDPAHMSLIQTYGSVHELRRRRSPLDSMFTGVLFDGLLGTQRVYANMADQTGRFRSQGGASRTYADVAFDLRAAASTVRPDLLKDIRPESGPADPRRALFRERNQRALASLTQLKYHYRKDASGDLRFSRRIPADNDIQRISNPGPYDGRPNVKMLGEIQECRLDLSTQVMPVDRFACSLNTATQIIQHTDTKHEDVLKAYGTGEALRPFPGLAEGIMVISDACPDGVLYAASKRALLKAEGPKIIRQDRSGTHTVLDFFQYKCAHEDLHAGRPLGCIIDLQTT